MSFTEQQIRALGRTVPARAIRSRVSAGKELTYIEGWFAIAEANRIFGFDGWDRETIETKCLVARETRGTYSAVYSARVRITVRSDGSAIVRDGHGTGEAQGPSAGEVHDRALKAAETDATKRALATFGRAFGLALYAGPGRRRPVKADVPATTNGAHLADKEPEPVQPAASATAAPPTRTDAEALGRHAMDLRTGSLAVDSIEAAAAAPADRPADPAKDQPTRHDQRPEGPGPAQTHRTGHGNGYATRQRIEKSALALSEPRRVRDKEHLRFVASQPCLLCSTTPSDPHHVRFAQPRAMARKVGDDFTVPLCRAHHRELHHSGNEAAWWHDMGIEPLEIAEQLWRETSGRARMPPL
jgi:hypothetical protein